MAKKNLTVIIRTNPFSWKAFEALRQAVGSAMEHNVNVIFIRDGVYTLTDWNPKLIGIEPFDKSISALGMMEAKIYAEEEAIRERGIKLKDWGVDINIKPKEEICELIKNSEVVLTW
ncbi:DsrE family protein [Hydrogenothermus marinus]|uniref:tRNA 2-thiouridine synthesizing protein C n=1 Tax=Hydrogenothermus marinus TaxID=133270 RepID=A0A3M0BHZ3_9AQUI|nr:DsrE family protein [Hydrogenothermus marinus]RMA97033.1 tRNA 2-thiouridine synthesizing protein C [Hydrogenothermus marinus]